MGARKPAGEEEGSMGIFGAVGGVGRPLRGVIAVVFLSGCGGPNDGVQVPSLPSSDREAPGVEALQGAWTLQSLQEAGRPADEAPAGAFVADFGVDGDLYIEADCNVCSAAYRATDAGTLEVIGPIPCTLAYCSSSPLDTRFLRLLEGASSWSTDEGTLRLSTPDGGALLLQRRS
jgi:heat shock protein HslJ